MCKKQKNLIKESWMLVLARKKQESIIIEVPIPNSNPQKKPRIERIIVKVTDIQRGVEDKVKLGFEAEKHITIHRQEIAIKIKNKIQRKPKQYLRIPQAMTRTEY
jgi:sRNA-binding carbon storage regulator CsrA